MTEADRRLAGEDRPKGTDPDGPEGSIRLIDGRTVLVRPVVAADQPAVAALYEGLSPESLAMRFGAVRSGFRASEVEMLSRPPGPDGLGLLAIAGGEAERAIALARYVRQPGAQEAELSVAVADDMQGRGVGTDLLEILLERAASDGIDALWATVRPGNHRMLEVFRALGCRERELLEAGEVLVRLEAPPDEELDEAATLRWMGNTANSLEPLFRPAAIAVVGASRDPDKPGGAVLRSLRSGPYPGPVFAVNRSASVVAGAPAYPALGALPRSVDLVVVAVPAAEVPAVAREAAANGARALLVLSAGFAETGPQGRALEAEVLHVARTSGMRVLGPNCLGLAATDPARTFDATFGSVGPRVGAIALASQSGGLGIGALAHCQARGIGLSAFVSLGNAADVAVEDLLAWWERDERTRCVLLYLEGFGNPRRFGQVARHVARSTPIVALKAGRGRSGQRAAGSHTAALASGEAPTDALFDLSGVVRVDTIEDLVGAGELLVAQPLPAGDRLAIIGNAGGLGVIAADAAEAGGLDVPQLSRALADRLTALGVLTAANPVDLGPTVGPPTLEAVGRAIRDARECDALLVVYAPIAGGDPIGMARAVQRLATGDMPVVGCMLGARPPSSTARWPVPWYPFPEPAVRAVAAASRARAARDRPPDPAPRIPGCDRPRARRALGHAPPGGWLDPLATAEVLAAYGLQVPRSRIVRSEEEARRAQEEIGAPVAVKVVSDRIVHKTDVGGVILGCDSPDGAADAYRRIAERIGGEHPLVALVQEMAPPGLDLIVGAVQDPQFGPLVLAGVGGIEAELWRDRSVALAPVGTRTAGEMWEGLRGEALLRGWRGAPGADRAALVECVVRVGRLAAEQPLLAELDLNPVRSLGPGRGLAVLDARARRADR